MWADDFNYNSYKLLALLCKRHKSLFASLLIFIYFQVNEHNILQLLIQDNWRREHLLYSCIMGIFVWDKFNVLVFDGDFGLGLLTLAYRLVLLCGTSKSPLNVAIHESLFQGFTKLLRLETQCYLFFSGYILVPALFRGLLVLINYCESFDVTFWGGGFERLTQRYHHSMVSFVSFCLVFQDWDKSEGDFGRAATSAGAPSQAVRFWKDWRLPETNQEYRLSRRPRNQQR